VNNNYRLEEHVGYWLLWHTKIQPLSMRQQLSWLTFPVALLPRPGAVSLSAPRLPAAWPGSAGPAWITWVLRHAIRVWRRVKPWGWFEWGRTRRELVTVCQDEP